MDIRCQRGIELAVPDHHNQKHLDTWTSLSVQRKALSLTFGSKMLLRLLLALSIWHLAVDAVKLARGNSVGVNIRKAIKATIPVIDTVKEAAYTAIDGVLSAPTVVDKVKEVFNAATSQRRELDDDDTKVPLATFASSRVSAKKATQTIEVQSKKISFPKLNVLKRAKDVINAYYSFTDAIETNKDINSSEIIKYKNNFAKYNLQEYTVVPTEINRLIDNDINNSNPVENVKEAYYKLVDSLATFALAFVSVFKAIAVLPAQIAAIPGAVSKVQEEMVMDTKRKQLQAREVYETIVKIVTLQAAKKSFERAKFKYSKTTRSIIKARDDFIGFAYSAKNTCSKISNGLNSLATKPQAARSPVVKIVRPTKKANEMKVELRSVNPQSPISPVFMSDDAPDVSMPIPITRTAIEADVNVEVATGTEGEQTNNESPHINQ